jgi:predicted RNase H-like nuclease (RuvC/YqgF family)
MPDKPNPSITDKVNDAPRFKEMEGFDAAIEYDEKIGLMLERNFARLQSSQSRQTEMTTRVSEAGARIKKIESDFEGEAKTIQLERRMAENGVRELKAEIEGKAKAITMVLRLALEQANIPKEDWHLYKPSFTQAGDLVSISKGPDKEALARQGKSAVEY